jgi:hypothetical protein
MSITKEQYIAVIDKALEVVEKGLKNNSYSKMQEELKLFGVTQIEGPRFCFNCSTHHKSHRCPNCDSLSEDL